MLGSNSGSGLKSSRPKLLIIAGVFVIVVFAGLAGFFFWQYMQLKANPNAVAEETTQRLVKKVGALYALPGEEQPTVAQVQDKEKLKDQAFFARAENGDYILIFTNAKLALLFREQENKLINVGPIALSDGDQGVVSGDQDEKPANNNQTKKQP